MAETGGDWERRVRALMMPAASADTLPSGSPIVPRWLSRRRYAAILSQFLHGEIAVAQICRRLADGMSDGVAAAFLRHQAAEEERHAALYAAYLARLDCPSAAPLFARSFAVCLDPAAPPLAVLAATAILFESETLALRRFAGAWLPCRVLGGLMRVVAADEARHIAFGRAYLAREVPTLAADDRSLASRWLEGLWDAAAATTTGEAGLDPLPRSWLRQRWSLHARELRQLGFTVAATPGR